MTMGLYTLISQDVVSMLATNVPRVCVTASMPDDYRVQVDGLGEITLGDLRAYLKERAAKADVTAPTEPPMDLPEVVPSAQPVSAEPEA